jgi:hypothetical protein
LRVNVYAEEMTDRVEVVEKNGFTGVRFWLALPVTLPDGCKSPTGTEIYQARGPFIHKPGDDDSAAVTFWGKAELKNALTKALKLLEDHK